MEKGYFKYIFFITTFTFTIIMILQNNNLKALTGQCFKKSDGKIVYVYCPCNCYAHKINDDGRCRNCWHFVDWKYPEIHKTSRANDQKKKE